MNFLHIIVALASLMEAAQADIRVGLSISSSGPAASLGIPGRYTVRLFPKEIAGIKVDYMVIDDGSIPGRAKDNFESLVDEHNVDVLIGGSIIPTAIPISEVAKSKSTPFIILSPLVSQGAT
ncbi:ABC transporter substrate-binding protein [Pseudomonas sp. D8002]|uniref:ABC transporter substrate-binding protein n=1 Tax=unclassified Pseudomonas TaxID=196821 RepID=UPI0015A1148B|nr:MULTISPECIES: ABC transporter substrate-binding protein [unclassified Pseudomonas]NWA91420.1 ABC transporter substrate-binding protein [Pseudomonas sp. D8002]NWB20993.1 ABC transporter substrate-binding protein [Pseudomonas sp. D4002]